MRGSRAASELSGFGHNVAEIGKVRSALTFVAAMALLAALIYIAAKAIDKDPAVFASIVAAAGAVAVAAYQRRWEKQQELDRLHREEISPTYKDLVDRLKDLDKIAATDQMEQFFKDLTTNLLIHGSGPVVKAWVQFKSAGAPEVEGDPSLILAYEQVLRAIRADLGHDDSALAPGDLLRLYVNDLDESLLAWGVAQTELGEGDGENGGHLAGT